MTTRDELSLAGELPLTGVQFTDRTQRGGRVIVVTTPNGITSYPLEALQSRPLPQGSARWQALWADDAQPRGGELL
ncbi:hypothetical protein BI347_22230 [Chromobacterium sphagni]|uniref:Uncharacterized protein n=1 Tax=Chromobacterium sphagni TaxID=1903179 RepID=A0A1S1WT92_9NEIS|nr:hypothetical protein BI347_22230 [Chromobacterium sphagni]